jgi:DNA-binding response OmpR family regulator
MDSNQPKTGKVLFVGRDIFLGTMVSQAVQKAGFDSQPVSPLQVRNAVLSDLSIRAIVVDLKESKENLGEIVDAAGLGSRPRIIGIAFHTDLESKRQAQKAGLDHVIHRSQIQTQLPHLLSEKKA